MGDLFSVLNVREGRNGIRILDFSPEVIEMPPPKKRSSKTSKAASIREVARALPKPVRPRDIMSAMKEKGVTVTYAQITSALKAGGFRRRGRRKKSAAASNNGLNVEALLAAKALIAKVGIATAAEEALAVLKKLG